MSLVLTASADKSKSIDVLETLLKHFMYPAINTEGRQNLLQHIEWMRRQVPDMKVDLKFETFPSTQTTLIQLAVSFAGNAPKAVS